MSHQKWNMLQQQQKRRSHRSAFFMQVVFEFNEQGREFPARASPNPFPCVPEHTHPGGILAPPVRMPGMLHSTENTLRMRHHHGEASIRSRYRSNALRRAVRVTRINFSRLPFVVDPAHRDNRLLDISRLREIGIAFAVRYRDRSLRSRHICKEDRGRIRYLDHREPAFELFRLITRELRPCMCARNDGF